MKAEKETKKVDEARRMRAETRKITEENSPYFKNNIKNF